MCSKAGVCVYVWNSSVSGHFCSLLLQPDQNQLSSISLVFHSRCFVFCFAWLFLNASAVFSLLFWGLLWCSPATFIPPHHSTRSAHLIEVAKGTWKTFSLFLLIWGVFVHFILSCRRYRFFFFLNLQLRSSRWMCNIYTQVLKYVERMFAWKRQPLCSLQTLRSVTVHTRPVGREA